MLFGHYRRPQKTRRYIVNLNRWRPEQQPRPRMIQTIAQCTPAVAPQGKSWRSQEQFFHQLGRPSATRAKRSTQNPEETLKTSIAALPMLGSEWRSTASSSHSREAESDSFLARREGNAEAIVGEHATMHAVALICPPRYLSAGCCVDATLVRKS